MNSDQTAFSSLLTAMFLMTSVTIAQTEKPNVVIILADIVGRGDGRYEALAKNAIFENQSTTEGKQT